MENKLDFLKGNMPFSLLPDKVLEGISELLKEIVYPKDELLYRQEVSKMKVVDIIVEGEYESFFYDNSEVKRAIELFKPGYCYGGMSILLNRKKSLKSTIVKKGTKVYFLHRKD